LPGMTPEQVQALLREGPGQEEGSRENGSGVD
jgi:hypothetical protein